MRYDGVLISLSLGDEEIVGVLKERRDGGRFVSGAVRPCAQQLKAGNSCGVGVEKEALRSLERPSGEVVVATYQFNPDSFDTEDAPYAMGLIDPVPKGRAEIESIVSILGFDKHIGVE